MEEKQKMIFITIIIVLALALCVCLILIGKYEKENKQLSKENEKYKNTGITIGDDTTNVVSEEEEDNFVPEATKESIFENRQDIIERTLKMYGLTNNGIELLYTEQDDLYNACLFIYDTQRDVDALFKESSEILTVDGQEYKLYKTEMPYEDYEKAVRETVSKEVFDKYFTKYAKNIGGKLYIVNLPKEETEKYEVKELKEITDNEYELTYIHKNGNQEEEKTTKVTFTEDEIGLDIINQIEL